MNILITGGTGQIGSELVRELSRQGHFTRVLTRNPDKTSLPPGAEPIIWDARTHRGWGEVMEDTDWVINLAGENLGEGRWNTARKERILQSRLQAGQALVEAIRQSQHKPQVLIQASAVGYYGITNSAPLAEDAPPGVDSLSQICVQWEDSTKAVEEMGVRRVVARLGVVLSPAKGALARLMLPYKFFIGGPLGSGRQWLSWIHPADVTAGLLYLAQEPRARGAYNLTAPNPLTNAQFGAVLGKVMHRPHWIPVPAFVLKILVGEMSIMVLEGQRPMPYRLQELGFSFRFPYAREALEDLLQK